MANYTAYDHELMLIYDNIQEQVYEALYLLHSNPQDEDVTQALKDLEFAQDVVRDIVML